MLRLTVSFAILTSLVLGQVSISASESSVTEPIPSSLSTEMSGIIPSVTDSTPSDADTISSVSTDTAPSADASSTEASSADMSITMSGPDGNSSIPSSISDYSSSTIDQTLNYTSLMYQPTNTTLITSVTPTSYSNDQLRYPNDPCPFTLPTAYQSPRLMVSSQNGRKTTAAAYGSNISNTTITYYNFDIPTDYAGKTCDIIFALPRQEQTIGGLYLFSGYPAESLIFSSVEPAAQYADPPSSGTQLGSLHVVPNASYTISSGPCEAGQTVGYSIMATGDAELYYHQESRTCPIGLYVTAA